MGNIITFSDKAGVFVVKGSINADKGIDLKSYKHSGISLDNTMA